MYYILQCFVQVTFELVKLISSSGFHLGNRLHHNLFFLIVKLILLLLICTILLLYTCLRLLLPSR